MAEAGLVPQDLLDEAFQELEQSGDWRARRALKALLQEEGEAEQVKLQGVLVQVDDADSEFWIGGERPLVYLAREGLQASALCLLAILSGAPKFDMDLDADDVDGFTALHFAANLGLSRLVGALLEKGASVEATTRDVGGLFEPGGRTPLHFAAASGRAEIARALLAARSDVRARDWSSVNPFVLACRRGHFALARELAEAFEGPRPEVPSEQELSGLELVEGMAVRERARQRRSIEGRPLLEQPFALENFWGGQECDELLAEVERTTAAIGWQSARHRHHPTVDIPASDVSPAVYTTVRRSLDQVVLPEMRRRYDTGPLRVKEAFFVKYEAPCEGKDNDHQPRQAGLGLHRDGTLLNCVILLNNASDFEGGGTVFAPPLDTTYRLQQGSCLCSCGQLLHGAAPVTKGTRYVLIAFIDEEAVFDDSDSDSSSECGERGGEM